MKKILKIVIKIKALNYLYVLYLNYLKQHSIKAYSQEGEDLVLNRLFDNKTNKGFYLDIGAHHPFRFSNTSFFYKKGWNGINIDAMPNSMKKFEIHRKRDINLEIGISEKAGILEYFVFNEPALNGFSSDLSYARENNEYKIIQKINIQTYPLGEILNKYKNQFETIDFMSVDVEGLDLMVLKSNNWELYRPTYIIIELLDTELKNIEQNEVYNYLNSLNYSLVSKLVHSAIFRDNCNK